MTALFSSSFRNLNINFLIKSLNIFPTEIVPPLSHYSIIILFMFFVAILSVLNILRGYCINIFHQLSARLRVYTVKLGGESYKDKIT